MRPSYRYTGHSYTGDTAKAYLTCLLQSDNVVYVCTIGHRSDNAVQHFAR